MRIPTQMVFCQPDQLNHLFATFSQFGIIFYKFINQQSFPDNLLNCHTWVQGGDRILENHLDSLMNGDFLLMA